MASIQQFKRNHQIYLMLTPNLLIFLALTIYPVIWALQYMFFSYDGINAAKFVGFDNFIRLFTRDDVFWRSVVNTLVYVGGKLVLTLPPAFILAVILNRKFRGQGLLQGIMFSPTIMSTAVMALMFYLIFNVYNGVLNHLLVATGLIQVPINWLGKDLAMLTCVMVGAWGGIGNYMIYFLAGLQSIPKEIYESAELDGVNGFQRMVHITIPMMGPILQVILMLSIIIAFQDMQSIMVLTEGGPFSATQVMFLYIYQLYFPISASANTLVNSDFGYGAAVSIVAAAIIGVVTCVYLYCSRKLDY
ncbi:ABC-type sugar transport system permease subunit [Hydrogenispora ethanolica]|jgi:raffinose/stachyose/melibiose transport system permease protein|uniref:ABC-type sugar transport system permease subunit n=1 Tax=Hydrogenispora ethanolica TaxID=1082276 RepID=A0A4R1RM77_HYDET|nr:sugar ABC transporter permease [Hydrogenispora ethanolica]TCL67371.1 ABC-type sugar transport system permease subunit [Hydrogenispora ethanolica]